MSLFSTQQQNQVSGPTARIRQYSLLGGCAFIFVLTAFIASSAIANISSRRTPSLKVLSQTTPQSGLQKATMVVDGHPLSVEVALTEEEQQRGLSFRDHLGENEGMLFRFTEVQPLTFWMRGMKFPLDIIFLRDNAVVDVANDVQPPAVTNGVPAVVSSIGPADSVLEINAGTAKKLGLIPGQSITIQQ
jgi:uncharacterized membrane protein (UPF0127 family)